MAVRCYGVFLQKDTGSVIEGYSLKNRFRESGEGHKAKAPEVYDALFEWFLDVRRELKDRLPKNAVF